MRLSAAVITLFGASVSAFSLGGDGQSVIIKDELDVPGQSPLKFCEADREKDIITIESVVLSPNPPQAGATLTIKASGIVKEDIVDGAYVNIQVKYGYIKLIDTRADLCEEIKNVNLECPIEKGRISIVKDVDLPKEIPPGKYTVQADVFTADDEHITCLNAVVFFKRGGAFLDL
ncbi:hypothetical protein OQA88_12935 [Cercophora sp. LCS_1]